MSQIGLRAKEIRQRRGDSQEAVARRAGISITTYVRIENGHNQPSIPTLRKVADALGVEVAELMAVRAS
jgi:transcriptional regulator with XRE-family HTH domain